MSFASQFTLPEILSLLGLVQSVYVLVYMLLRSGSFLNAVIPSLYFGFLGIAFFLDAAAGRWSGGFEQYAPLQWLFWFSGVPLGALLIFQIAQVPEPPRPKYFLLLLLIPISFLPFYAIPEIGLLYSSGLVIGAFSLLAIWLRRDLLDGLHKNPKFGKERFWLILALIGLTTAFLAATFSYVRADISNEQWVLIRTVLGITFVYLATTSLFRIYPQALKLDRGLAAGPETPVSPTEKRVLDKLAILLERDKVYQDAGFGRADLARELDIGEASLSRIVNVHYGKTIPQILNDYRVTEARKMLVETDVPIQTIYEESGFNSITTFNRVFKELTGNTPKDFRARSKG